jgi:A/G-specific adenine glycosylase
MLPGSKTRQIRRSLLHWYDKTRRDLPWRHTRDPYAIWIAETMLQQTQVKTVLPYYRRFLGAFPTLESLDRAPKEKVMALWSGLGYYRRAENLKEAARILASRYGGKLPRNFEALLRLPGVGPYTAGALMSIAFKQRYPALDGNAKRVISRLLNLRTEAKVSEGAWQLVPPSRPGHFNQALMELGSAICHPKNPSCPKCPLSKYCVTKTLGRSLSQLRPKPHKANYVEWPMVIIQKDGKVLLHRRSQGGLLRGLWEVPGGKREGKEKVMATVSRHLVGPGIKGYGIFKIGEIRHSITRYRIRSPLFVFSDSKSPRLPRTTEGLVRKRGDDCSGLSARAAPQCHEHKPVVRGFLESSWRWVPIASLHRYPLSSLSLKAIRLFTGQRAIPDRG